MTDANPVTIVSNRLPIVLDRRDGEWTVEPGSGGLVEAMTPIMEHRGGRWIGWPGATTEELEDGTRLPLDELDAAYDIVPVTLSERDVTDYYRGFANSIVWPLFHGFPDRCSFEPRFWETYLNVNRKFADCIEGELEGDQTLWVHDYHLMHVAHMLAESDARPDRIGFFLHIPFPSLENFVKMPWRADLMRALLAFDLVGFQSNRDYRRCLECVELLMPGCQVDDSGPVARLDVDGHVCTIGVFPIGIDFDSWDARARSTEVERIANLLRRETAPYDVVLGVDRLDYTKGLVERFRAFERALERHPDLRESVMLFQLVVPSREDVPEYASLKREVDRLVGRINGRFSTPSWQPIRYMYNTLEHDELTALYRLAAVGLVTPLCDGMNLVSKEYCVCQVEEKGVLILSEMAGAAGQLEGGALLVNPYHIDGTADAIHEAVQMPSEARADRMQTLRNTIAETNVDRWADSFFEALAEPASLAEPSQSEYLPTIDTH